VPLLAGAESVHGVLQVGPLPMLASAPAGIDSTRTGVPEELNPGMLLKLGMLRLGMLKLGMLGIPVHAESAAPQTAKAIARLIIRSYLALPGLRGRLTLRLRSWRQYEISGCRRNPWPAGRIAIAGDG